ncbi:porin [Pseudopedobacter beijingensis]|uniref:Porin n=1 Tax=Pseudopedobacter beijingensis TaxID=1207056 RepID=A0ABW4IDP2_9SPHI
MKKIIVFSAVMLGAGGSVLAQENKLAISGYTEIYYQQDFNNPTNNARPGFIYSHNRNNEVSLNLGVIKATYNTGNLKMNLGLGVGSYMNANYAGEEGVLKNVYEANISLKLSKEHNLWLEAGILPSHIGFESAVGADCFTLTRSIMAENSPYFETGTRLSYVTPDKKWQMVLLVLNGWQRIQRQDGNTTPAFGHQLVFKPNEKITLNSSSFIGNDAPEEIRKMRYFHDLYGQFQLTDKFTLIGGFDIGIQQKEKKTNQYDIWYAPALIMKCALTDKLSMTARGEYYNDESGVIASTDQSDGVQIFGASFNVDYKILPNLYWRTEIKGLRDKNVLFVNRENKLRKDNQSITTSIAVYF